MTYGKLALCVGATAAAFVVPAPHDCLSAQALQMGSFAQTTSAPSNEKGYIGVGVAPITPEVSLVLDIKQGGGELVTNIAPDGPSQRAGIMPGDVITSVNGTTISPNQTLTYLIANLTPRTSVNLQLIRKGQRLTKIVKLISRPSEQALTAERNAEPSIKSVNTLVNTAPTRRALGRNMLRCERVENIGNAKNVYSAYLDVEEGKIVALEGFNDRDETGKMLFVPTGHTSSASWLRPITYKLAPDIVEMAHDNGNKGASMSQNSYESLDGSQRDVFSTTFAVDLQIPGTTRRSNDAGELGLRILKNGKQVWQLTDIGSISSYDAPKITMTQHFRNGEENNWLNGLIKAEVRFRGQTVATYEFDVSQMNAKAMRSRGDGALLNAPYIPGAIPAGCKLEPIPY